MTDNPGQKLFSTQEIIGKQVISLDGKDLGAVARVLVDPQSGSVAGFTVTSKGWFKGEKALEFKSVKSIGSYALTLETSELLVPLNTLPKLEKLATEFNIYNSRVITPTGDLLGSIDDFSFEAVSGTIVNYLLSGGLIKNLMQGKAIVLKDFIEKLGPDVIIAKENVGENLIKADAGLTDSLDSWKENIGDLKEDVDKGWDRTLAKAKEVSKKLGEKFKVGEEPKDKSYSSEVEEQTLTKGEEEK